MSKYVNIFLFTFLLAACGPSTDIDYAQPLSPCMKRVDIALLNEACQVFEDQLATQYDHTDLSDAYRAFLEDMAVFNIDPKFCLTSASTDMLDEFRSTGLFDKIWLESSLVLDARYGNQFSRNDYFPPGSEDYYLLDPNNFYSICMRKADQAPAVADYFQTLRNRPNTSFTSTASNLANELSKTELDQGLTRLAIAIGFFYEMAVMFE